MLIFKGGMIMIKNKYQQLSYAEQKKAREKYYNTPIGKTNKNRFNRLLLCGILAIIYSFILIIDTIIEEKSFWNYILAAVMLIFGLIFLIGRYKIIVRNVNNFLIKHK